MSNSQLKNQKETSCLFWTKASTGGFTSFNENVTGGQTTGQTTTPTGTTQMQKVYVLESDISSAQDRVRVMENNSTFG